MQRLRSLLFLVLMPSVIVATLSPKQQTPLLHETSHENISQALFDELEELARIVDISYCVGTLNTGVDPPFSCLSYCRDFPEFELVQTWNTGITLADSCGFIAISHAPENPRIIVAFRGTYSIANALADLSIAQQDYVPYPSDGHSANEDKCVGCAVHAGFLRSWSQTEEIIGKVVSALVHDHPYYKLEVVGHSLGGAVAALAGLDFERRGWKPKVTTFGEPKVGNKALAAWINMKFKNETFRRITHAKDPIPLLPLESMGYTHHEHEYFISKSSLPYEPSDVQICEGNEDPSCVAGGYLNAFEILWAHRDYFHRMGLCVPLDSFFRKFGFDWSEEEGDEPESEELALEVTEQLNEELRRRAVR